MYKYLEVIDKYVNVNYDNCVLRMSLNDKSDSYIQQLVSELKGRHNLNRYQVRMRIVDSALKLI
jgi:septum formation topological specificity factor MinE